MTDCLAHTSSGLGRSSVFGEWFSLWLGCRALLILLAVSVVCETGEAASGKVLRDLEGRHVNVQFLNWESDGGLSFRGPEGETFRREPSEIIRYGRGVHDRRGQGLLLVDGSWLVGRVAEINENECRVRGRYFSASIPRPLVRAALLSAPSIDGLQEEIIRQAFAAEGSDDIVIGIDGDRTSGALRSKSRTAGERAVVWQRGAKELNLLAGARSLQVSASRVRGIVFSPLLTPLVPDDPEAMVVGLADGSRLRVRRWSVVAAKGAAEKGAVEVGEAAEHHTKVELACGAELALPPPLEAAAAVVYLSTGQIDEAARRLSDESPLRVRVQPLFGAAYDRALPAADRAAENRATVGGDWFENVVEMPAASQAVYRGMAEGGLFRAEVAIRDPDIPDAAAGSVRFRVLVVGREGLLREVWKSEPMRGAGPMRGDGGLVEVLVTIPPTAAVVLAVEPAERGGAGDRAVWIDPVVTAF